MVDGRPGLRLSSVVCRGLPRIAEDVHAVRPFSLGRDLKFEFHSPDVQINRSFVRKERIVVTQNVLQVQSFGTLATSASFGCPWPAKLTALGVEPPLSPAIGVAGTLPPLSLRRIDLAVSHFSNCLAHVSQALEGMPSGWKRAS